MIQNIINGSNGRAMPITIFPTSSPNGALCPVLIFSHGFKGFKDWGTFPILLQEIAKFGIHCIAYNFSHNGGTIDQQIDFPDLKAFEKNTFSKELFDLDCVLNWANNTAIATKYAFDLSNIVLMGHSRGGGISILKAGQDHRITSLITLASVADFGTRFPKGEKLQKWKENKIEYIQNTRTGQKMPLSFDLFADYKRILMP